MQDNPKNDMQSLLMKPKECATLSGLSVRSITRMCSEGQLAAVKLRGAWRINRAEFMRIIGVQAQA